MAQGQRALQQSQETLRTFQGLIRPTTRGNTPVLTTLRQLQVGISGPSSRQYAALRRPLGRALGATSAARLASAVLADRGWMAAALRVLTAVNSCPCHIYTHRS